RRAGVRGRTGDPGRRGLTRDPGSRGARSYGIIGGMGDALPGGIGLWSGFLDRLPAADAVAAARTVEAAGLGLIWLQEFSGVDPFVRAALYLGGTDHLVV